MLRGQRELLLDLHWQLHSSLLAIAFFITGHCYAKFSKTLRQCLGIACISKNAYYEVIKLVYPHITEILNEMREDEKNRMKKLPSNDMGSWQRAVVTSDGVWQTGGHFSKNGSFVIKKYFTGGLLWYGHKCMKGNDDVVDEDLYKGTAKSMEGCLADKCYDKMLIQVLSSLYISTNLKLEF